jgi:hypothetical protein
MSKLRAVSLAPLRVSRTPFRKVDLDPDKRRNRPSGFGSSASFRLSVSVQTVDATPSGIKLFSKAVFMKQGKRFGLSAEQKSDV